MLEQRKAGVQRDWGRGYPPIGDGLRLALHAVAQSILLAGFGGLIWLACCSGFAL